LEVLEDSGNEDFIRRAIGADLGISGVDYAVADTGSLVLVTAPGRARSISLLAPIHIAIVKPNQLLASLNELFPVLRRQSRELPSAITFITGPSRTADIEMTLVVGVHGPQQLHVVLLDRDRVVGRG
jgi:L-lactate dehydrogenase complex protein LldG